MRVGIYAGQFNPESGGSSSLKSLVLNALKNYSGEHEFLLFQGCNSQPAQGMPLPVVAYDDRGESRRLAIRRAIYGLLAGPVAGMRASRSTPNRLPPGKIAQGLYYSPLDRHARERGVDLLWYFTPFYQKTSLPHIYTLYDLEHITKPYFPEVSVTGWDWAARENCFREALPRALKVITGTEVGREQVLKFYGVCPDNVAVIPFPSPSSWPGGDNDGDILAKYGLRKPYLFYPAQFWPHKNHISILQALSLMKLEEGNCLDMVFVGSDKGNRGYVEAKAHDLGLGDSVHFLGFIPDEHLPGLYRNAYALLFASYFGPDNLPPLEAFSLGCPVIASRVAGADEQLKDAALLFDPGDVADLVRVIRRLEREQGLRRDLIRRGHERASFSASDYVERVIMIIDSFKSIRHCWGDFYRQI